MDRGRQIPEKEAETAEQVADPTGNGRLEPEPSPHPRDRSSRRTNPAENEIREDGNPGTESPEKMETEISATRRGNVPTERRNGDKHADRTVLDEIPADAQNEGTAPQEELAAIGEPATSTTEDSEEAAPLQAASEPEVETPTSSGTPEPSSGAAEPAPEPTPNSETELNKSKRISGQGMPRQFKTPKTRRFHQLRAVSTPQVAHLTEHLAYIKVARLLSGSICPNYELNELIIECFRSVFCTEFGSSFFNMIFSKKPTNKCLYNIIFYLNINLLSSTKCSWSTNIQHRIFVVVI